MNFTVIEPALLAWFITLAGFGATDVCQWENAPRKAHNGRLALLSWVTTDGVGGDETRYEDNTGSVDPLTELVPVVVGFRVGVLQLSVEVHDQRSGQTARQVLETLRSRLRRPSSIAALKAVNVSLGARAGAVVQADYRVDQRWVSRCTLDVRLNLSSHDIDTTGATGTIETVGLNSTFTDPAGAALPASLQITGSVPT